MRPLVAFSSGARVLRGVVEDGEGVRRSRRCDAPGLVRPRLGAEGVCPPHRRRGGYPRRRRGTHPFRPSTVRVTLTTTVVHEATRTSAGRRFGPEPPTRATAQKNHTHSARTTQTT